MGDFDSLLRRARREVDDGLLPSCQLAVARNGELECFETIGASPNTAYVVMSVTKALTAGAVWALLSDGVVSVDTEVRDLVPELPAGVTVDHLLLHTAGFPTARVSAAAWNDRPARRAEIAQWRLTFEPGSRFEYHATSAAWALAETLFEATGFDHREYFATRIAAPIGLRGLRLGVPPEEQASIDIAEVAFVGDPPAPEELERAFGVREIRLPGMADDTLLEFNTADGRAAGVPGAGAVATAADVALYFQEMLFNAKGAWNPEVLADGTGCAHNRFADPWTSVPANRSRGLVIAGDDGKAHMRQAHFGPSVSPRTFGHAGAGGQIAWADPATGRSFCYLTNGLDNDVLRESKRCYALSRRAAELEM